MERTFQDDDRERRVVTSEGNQVGRVREVEEDRATVERSDDDDDSLTDEIKEMLGWKDDDDTHELRRDDVDRHEEDRLYLRQQR